MTIGASQSKGDWKRDHQVPESVRNLGRRRVVGFRYMFGHSQRKIEEKKIDQAPNLESAANPHPGVPKQPKIVPLNSNRRVVPKLRNADICTRGFLFNCDA